MDTSDKRDAEPATRRLRTLDEKLSILAEAARPGASVAAIARKHEVNANLLFAWRRLQRRGLLEAQRHAPPLLAVTLDTPTLTPTRAASTVATKSVRTRSEAVTLTADSCIEVLIGEQVRVRLHGEAQRALLARLLEWMPSR